MNKNLILKKELDNIKGNGLLNKTKLEYSIKIISIIQNNPDVLEQILLELGITKETFFNYIENEKQANITFYEQVLEIAKQKSNIK